MRRHRHFLKEEFEGEKETFIDTISEEQIEINTLKAEATEEIDGLVTSNQIIAGVSEDTTTLESIAESLTGVEEISDAHAKSLELVTESYSRKWCLDSVKLKAESFSYKSPAVLVTESIKGYLSVLMLYLGTYIAAVAVVTLVITALMVAYDSIASKIKTYRTQSNDIIAGMKQRIENSTLATVSETDVMPSRWGWVKKLHRNGEFLGKDVGELIALLDRCSKYKLPIDVDPGTSVNKCAADLLISLFPAGPDSKGVYHLLGDRSFLIETEKVDGLIVPINFTIVPVDKKAKINYNKVDLPELSSENIAKLMSAVNKCSVAVEDKGKDTKTALAKLKKRVEEESKKNTEVSSEDKDNAARNKMISNTMSALSKECYIVELTALMEGVLGYAQASVNVKPLRPM